MIYIRSELKQETRHTLKSLTHQPPGNDILLVTGAGCDLVTGAGCDLATAKVENAGGLHNVARGHGSHEAKPRRLWAVTSRGDQVDPAAVTNRDQAVGTTSLDELGGPGCAHGAIHVVIVPGYHCVSIIHERSSAIK